MPAAIQQTAINEEKMSAFLGKVVGDFGASLSSALVYLGQKLGLYQALAAVDQRRRPNWPSGQIPMNGMCGNGSLTRRPVVMLSTTRPAERTASRQSKPWRLPTSKVRFMLVAVFS